MNSKALYTRFVFFLIAFVCCNAFAQEQKPNIARSDVAYFPFNHTTNDESGNSNHVGIYADSSVKEPQIYLVKDRWGDDRNALKLSGNAKTNAYVINSNSFKTIESRQELSFSIWFLNQNEQKSVRNGPENVFPILSKISSVDNMGWSLLINQKGDLEFNASPGRKIIYDYDFPEDKWQNIVLTYKSPEGDANLYIDGQLIDGKIDGNSKAEGGLMRTDGDLFIGFARRDNTEYHANGEFDDIRIYNRILMDEEVKLLFDEQPDRKKPFIKITSYDFSNGNIPRVDTEKVKLTGVAYDESQMQLFINGKEARVNPQHFFDIVYPLELGINHFTLRGTDSRNNGVIQNYSIERIEATPESETVVQETKADTIIAETKETVRGTPTPIPGLEPEIAEQETGVYYALLIGNSNYQSPEIVQLDNPIRDAERLNKVLTQQYNFDPKNVTFLRDATFRTLILELDRLTELVTPNDNLLIFYAGHGHWDTKRKLGYWLPADAEKSNTVNWLTNSRIKDYINSIMSKHTLVISDACFSGGIFKTRSAFSDASRAINMLYESPSRKAMTSGTLTVVPDESVFVRYLVKKLEDNPQKYLSADKLFNSFREIVINNSPTEPQYGVIQDVGDELGEFIFIKRD